MSAPEPDESFECRSSAVLLNLRLAIEQNPSGKITMTADDLDLLMMVIDKFQHEASTVLYAVKRMLRISQDN